MVKDPSLFSLNSPKGMLHLWAASKARVSSVSTRSQAAAGENQTVLRHVQHAGKPDRIVIVTVE